MTTSTPLRKSVMRRQERHWSGTRPFPVSSIFPITLPSAGVQYLMETGRKVGTDVLVAGFNNIHAVRTHYLPISSAEHAIEEITEGLVGEMDKTGDLNRIVYSKTIIRKNK